MKTTVKIKKQRATKSTKLVEKTKAAKKLNEAKTPTTKKISAKSKTLGKKKRPTVKTSSKITSGISEMVYATAKGLHAVGAIDKTTMRKFDALCLPQIPNYTAAQIKLIRERCNLSQQVFAAYLNASPSALQKWERGERTPDGLALKLLNLVDRKGLQALV